MSQPAQLTLQDIINMASIISAANKTGGVFSDADLTPVGALRDKLVSIITYHQKKSDEEKATEASATPGVTSV
jgi:hypothetical protein